MSTCERCGATFHCAMKDGATDAPCWCTLLPPAVPVPRQEGDDVSTTVGCWCPGCLKAHIVALQRRR
ncbi:cysteine-rich CWC family protein [Massilia sp. METH4]|uniref:cysteine-rich CWC family protein n=1 Tax=Massilia sp. METH4 TaxID=3123041 RepID=UPI0030D2EB92